MIFLKNETIQDNVLKNGKWKNHACNQAIFMTEKLVLYALINKKKLFENNQFAFMLFYCKKGGSCTELCTDDDSKDIRNFCLVSSLTIPTVIISTACILHGGKTDLKKERLWGVCAKFCPIIARPQTKIIGTFADFFSLCVRQDSGKAFSWKVESLNANFRTGNN